MDSPGMLWLIAIILMAFGLANSPKAHKPNTYQMEQGTR